MRSIEVVRQAASLGFPRTTTGLVQLVDDDDAIASEEESYFAGVVRLSFSSAFGSFAPSDKYFLVQRH